MEAVRDKIKVRLDVGHETMWLTRFDEEGCALVTYQVNPADVGAAFGEFGISTGLLVHDTLFWNQVGGETRIGIYVKPQMRKIVLVAGKKPEQLKVPMPGLVWVGQGRDYWMWAVTRRPREANDILCVAPLPNVHLDGQVCFGNVKAPACKAETIGVALELFFESDFNFHLVEDKIRGGIVDPLPWETGEDRLPNRPFYEGEFEEEEEEEEYDGGNLIALMRRMAGRKETVFPEAFLISTIPVITMGNVALADKRVRGKR